MDTLSTEQFKRVNPQHCLVFLLLFSNPPVPERLMTSSLPRSWILTASSAMPSSLRPLQSRSQILLKLHLKWASLSEPTTPSTKGDNKEHVNECVILTPGRTLQRPPVYQIVGRPPLPVHSHVACDAPTM